MQLLETGVENDLVLSLVVFSLQYILVNHEYWKYKVKHVRWKITLKVCYCCSQLLHYQETLIWKIGSTFPVG